MITLDKLCEELEIPRELAKEYSDNFDPALSGKLAHLLSYPFIKDSLSQIKDKKGQELYRQFINELFEGLYGFQNQEHLKYMTNFRDCYRETQNLIRPDSLRTQESKELKSKIKNILEPYRQDLGNNEIGCLLYGSVFYGDSGEKSDIDIIFCTESKTHEVESALAKINDELKNKPEFDRHKYDSYNLRDIQEKLKKIAEGKTGSITDYTPNGDPWTLFSIKNGYLPILFSEEIVEKPGLITGELQKTRELLINAIHKDPILNFMVTYALAENIGIRTKKMNLS